MKLSIVIPVYRSIGTLARCVDSVLNQPFADYELILVDDGSTDGSAQLCDEYALNDERVRVIHKKNGGLSSARNAGIEISQGEYITFIDSDDFIGDNTLAIVMKRLSAHPDYDILEYPVLWHYGGEDQTLQKFGTDDYSDMRSYWIDCKAYKHSYACNKIFVRRLFDDVRFPEGKLFEDAHTLPLILERCHLVGCTEEGLYYYTSNPEGITMTADGAALRDLLTAHVAQLKRLSLTDSLTEYYCHVLNIQLDVYADTREAPILPVPAISLSEARRQGLGIKTRMKLLALKTLGLKNLCKIHRMTHHKGH